MTAAEMKKKLMKSLHYNSLYKCVKQVELFQLPSGTVRSKMSTLESAKPLLVLLFFELSEHS